MTKADVIAILEEGYTVQDLKIIIRRLKADYGYNLVTSVNRDQLLDQLEFWVSRDDLMNTLDVVFPDWTEEETDGDEEEA